jgi:hypothetical protein
VTDQSNAGHQAAHCAQVREEAAVALLVHSDPSPEVLAHLDACPPCRDEYLDLAALPPLLDAARSVAGGPPAPTTLPSVHLLDRLLRQVARRRRRRHMITALATAAAVVAIALPTVRWIDRDDAGVGSALPGHPLTTSTSTSSRSSSESSFGPGGGVASFAGSGSDPDSGARADVAVRAMGKASELSVSVHGIPAGGHCRLVVHDDAGHSLQAGVWVVEATYDEPYYERVELAPESISRVELVDDQTGRRIVDVPIHQV